MARPRSQARKPAARSGKPAARSTMVRSKDRATSPVAARRAVLKRIRDDGVEHVLFWFTDLEGHLKSFAITPAEMQGLTHGRMGLPRDGARARSGRPS